MIIEACLEVWRRIFKLVFRAAVWFPAIWRSLVQPDGRIELRREARGGCAIWSKAQLQAVESALDVYIRVRLPLIYVSARLIELRNYDAVKWSSIAISVVPVQCLVEGVRADALRANHISVSYARQGGFRIWYDLYLWGATRIQCHYVAWCWWCWSKDEGLGKLAGAGCASLEWIVQQGAVRIFWKLKWP